MKRTIAIILVLGLLFSMAFNTNIVVVAQEITEIANLKVNDEVNPTCVDSDAPRFSWQMKSDIARQRQTAYKIVVAKDEGLTDIAWNSGKITDDKSVGIAYEGTALTPSTTYYWSVTVFDKSGSPLSADTQKFETGLMNKSNSWNDSSWISVSGGQAPSIPDNFCYTVEGDFTLQTTAVGLIFNALNQGNLYMWQMQFEGNRVVLRPHKRTNNSWDSYGEAYKTDITDLVRSAENIKTNAANIKVEVTKTTVKTYVNGTLAISMTAAQAGGIGPYLGKIGVRSNLETRGTADNMKLIDYTNNAAGNIIYSYDFDSENPFHAGNIENGKFIVYGVDELIPFDPPSAYRKEFSTDAGKNVKSAKLYSTALGVYDVFINNSRVGFQNADGDTIYDELKPGYTQPNVRVNYFVYDVAHLIKTDAPNAIASIVSSGWWNGMVVRREGEGHTAFRAKLVINYTDGTSKIIGTDTTWKATYNGPISLGDIYLGETYDGTYDPAWKSAGFSDLGWAAADINIDFGGVITAAEDGSKVRARHDLELSPKEINVYYGAINANENQFGNINIIGTYADGDKIELAVGEKAVFDMGQNFAGWPVIEVEGAHGTVVTTRHSEMLNDNDGIKARGNDGPEGSVYVAAYRRSKSTAQYKMSGQGIEKYNSTHAYYGFRYVEVSATAPITIHSLKGEVLTAIHEDTGSLTTSNENVNQLISNVAWGLYSNMHSIPTACPQRDEREAWTGDTQAVSTTGMYYSDSKSHFSKWMLDVRDTQNSAGAFSEIAPNHGFDFWYGAAGWADAGIIVPYNIYKMYGDKAILQDNWAAMQKYMDVFMASTNKEGGQLSFGDWLSFESNDDTIRRMIAIAYYAWDAQMMAEMAAALGKTADIAKYNAVYETEKAHFISRYVNADGSLVRTEQTACLMALKMDLLPNDASREKVKQTLLDNIKRNGDKLQTGFIGTAAILNTLSEIGADETAYKILLQRGNPSWLYSVDQGATTIWERWDSYTKESGFSDVAMNSFNHFAYGAVGEWMYGYMAGIMSDIDNPGFKNVILQPRPDQTMKFVEGSFESAYGKIISNWKYEGNNFIYSAVVPANATATIYLPIETGKSVSVNSKAVTALSLANDGIEYVETKDGKAIFNAVSGVFEFITEITKNYYITFETGGESRAFSLECLVKINGGAAQVMPSIFKATQGEEITIEAIPSNDIDYKFTSWSGAVSSKNSVITFSANEDMKLCANFAWNGYESLAIGAGASASNPFYHDSWKPEYLVDGILSSVTGSLGYSSEGMESASPSAKPWIMLDLSSAKSFDRLHIYPRTDALTLLGTTCNFPIDFTVQVSDNQSSWTMIAQYQGDAPQKKPLVLQLDAAVSARYVRININRIADPASDGSGNRVQLAEIGIYNTADRIVLTSDIFDIRANGFITNVTAQTTFDGFIAGFETNGSIKVKTKDGTLVTSGIIKTGMILEFNGTDLYEIAVNGDLDGDGAVGIVDITMLRDFILKITAAEPTETQKYAGDLNGDDKINLIDIMRLRKIILS